MILFVAYLHDGDDDDDDEDGDDDGDEAYAIMFISYVQ